jgi:hypothetical protein
MTSCRREPGRPLPIPREAGELLTRWGGIWGRPGLRGEVRVEFSPRLTRSLGRCLPRRGVIRLNPVLVEPGWRDHFPEVLCHEAAHVVAFALHGRRRPHGPEWRRLMIAAGFEPRAAIRVDGGRVDVARGGIGRRGSRGESGRPSGPGGPGPVGRAAQRIRALRPRRSRPGVVYSHRCPVCQSVWTARRPMRRWRCPTCFDLEGRGALIITRRPGAAPR